MAGENRQNDGRETKRGKVPASLANLKGGSRKGIPNKTTTALKDAILKAAEEAGGKEGLIGYLKTQATENPQSFMPLLGKVLPLQLTGEGGGPIQTQDLSEDRQAVLGLIDQLAKRSADTDRPTLQ